MNDESTETTQHVVTCYDCGFEEVWEDGDKAIRRRDLHREENGHEVYKQKEKVRSDRSVEKGAGSDE